MTNATPQLVVVLSGGLDSAVLLHHLKAKGQAARAVTVDYGQRHRREIDSAQAIAARAGIEHDVVDLAPIAKVLPGSSQTDAAVPVPHGHYTDDTMRATVVPNRNMLLLSVGLCIAAARGLDGVAYGAHAGDHDIYPDCREEFVQKMDWAARLCHYQPLSIRAPFNSWTKADIVWRGRELRVPFELTWTCYEGARVPCGKCGACVERAEAFAACRANDPLEPTP